MSLEDKLKNQHRTEISALNAIVQLGANSSESSSAVDVKLASLARTPNIIRSSDEGSIAETCYSFSVANVGVADGVILGVAILAGETLSFDAGALNNFYTAGSITYDGTGTELVIVYNS